MQSAPIDELERRINLLRKLTNAALALRRREFHAARLEIARERKEIARGRLELAREKQLSKSASSASSAASASTESTGAPRKKAPKGNTSRNSAAPGAEAAASRLSPPSTASASDFPVSDFRFPISQDFAAGKNQPDILSGPIMPPHGSNVIQSINASLSKAPHLSHLS